MFTTFNTNVSHSILSAGRNVYSTPVRHPTRKLGFHDFIYIIDGKWEIGFDENIFSLKKDDILILPSGKLHYGITPCSPQTKTMYIHASCENGDSVSDGDKCLLSEHSVSLPPLISADKNNNVKTLFVQILSDFCSENRMQAAARFILLLCELYASACTGSKQTLIANDIKNIICTNLNKNFSNQELAARLSVSQRTAENAFRSCFNTSIHQYALHTKIEKAKEFLVGFPEMKIIDIALSLGFYDEYHFSKCFKNTARLSPTEYRMQSLCTEHITCR